MENAIERSVILTRNEIISPEHLPVSIKELDSNLYHPETDILEGRSLKDVEKQMIIQTLSDTGGNRTRAAEILGISRRSLQMKLKQLNLKI